MTIPDKADFRPSAETLRKWLATRKPAIQVGGVQMPGFFNDAGNGSDAAWVYVAVLGEFIGLLATVYAGIRGGGIFLFFAILTILMFVFCDFFFAQKLHRNEAYKTELKTCKLLEKDEDKARIAAINIELRKGNFLNFLLQTGIILIALIKVFGIVILGLFNHPLLYIPFAIIYLIVAYVHLKHTGYFMAYFATERSIEKEHRMFATGRHKAQTTHEPIRTKSELSNIPIKHVPHEIVKDESEPLTYRINARGILTDSDIVSLITGQDDANKIALFKACRKLQLENIQAAES